MFSVEGAGYGFLAAWFITCVFAMTRILPLNALLGVQFGFREAWSSASAGEAGYPSTALSRVGDGVRDGTPLGSEFSGTNAGWGKKLGLAERSSTVCHNRKFTRSFLRQK